MPEVFSNNAEGVLAAGIDEHETEVVLTEPLGSTWFAGYLPPGGFQRATITNPDNPRFYEVVRITAASGYTLTVQRPADEYYGQRAWAAGSRISARVTADMLASFAQVGFVAPNVLAIGKNAVGSSSARVTFPRAPVVSLAPPWGDDHQLSPSEYPVGAEAIYRSQSIDIGTPKLYDPVGGSYYHGDVVTPNPPNGRQYQLIGLLSGAGSAGGTVAFPGTDWDVVEANNKYDPDEQVGWWVPTVMGSPTTLEIQIPQNLMVTEIGFLPMVNLATTPAVVSIGTTSVPTAYVSGASVDGNYRLPIAAHVNVESTVLVTVDTPADDALVGSFYFKGIEGSSSSGM